MQCQVREKEGLTEARQEGDHVRWRKRSYSVDFYFDLFPPLWLENEATHIQCTPQTAAKRAEAELVAASRVTDKMQVRFEEDEGFALGRQL